MRKTSWVLIRRVFLGLLFVGVILYSLSLLQNCGVMGNY